jgi:hypothetical protein
MKNLCTTKIASIMFGIGFACLLSSCNKNDELTPDSQSVGSSTNLLATSTKEVKVVDGILKFESKEQFKNVLEDLQKNKVTDGFDNLQGFESMPEVLKKFDKSTLIGMSNNHSAGEYSDLVYIKEAGEYDQLIPIVRDRTFASILNKDAMVQIGDEYFKVTKDKIYKAKGILSKEEKQNFDKLPQSFANVQVQEKKVEVIPNSYYANNKSSKVNGERYYNHDGNTFRFVSNLNQQNFWGIYWYMNACAYHEELSSFLWWDWWSNADVDEIKVTIDGTIVDPGGFPHPINAWATAYNSCYVSWYKSDWFTPSWSWDWNTNLTGSGKGRNGNTYYF